MGISAVGSILPNICAIVLSSSRHIEHFAGADTLKRVGAVSQRSHHETLGSSTIGRPELHVSTIRYRAARHIEHHARIERRNHRIDARGHIGVHSEHLQIPGNFDFRSIVFCAFVTFNLILRAIYTIVKRY